MLKGGRSKPSEVIAEVTDGTTTIAKLARRRAALRAVIRWERELSKGNCADLAEIGKEEGLSKRKLLNTIRQDEELQKQLFQPAMVEAKMGLVKAVRQAYHSIDDPDVQSGDQRGWAEFLARLIGGQYEKKQAVGGNLIIANLIPQLPPNLAHLEGRIVDVDSEVRSLDDLGA
jgi:hypothetical protein